MDSVPAFLKAAAAEFTANGTPLYIVGGWPRNSLLGLPGGDFDICSALTGEEAAAIFERMGAKAIDRNTTLGTFSVVCAQGEAEYTAFRTESYGEGGAHRPLEVSFHATMEQDALRRDFTVNALYYNITEANIIDPLGGLADIGSRLLRTCRKPADTFADDGLRLMRLPRLACELGFYAEPETFAAAKANAALIGDIAPERVRAELERLLLCDIRYPQGERTMVLKGLHLLDDLGLLARIIPEMAACRNVRQRADYHDYDVLEHLLQCCAHTPPVLSLRLAGLLHDIGKPPALELTGKMVNHDRLGEEMARGVLNRLRCSNALTAEVCALVRRHMADLDGRTGEKRLRLFFVEQGRERSLMLVELRRADVYGSKAVQPQLDPAEKWAILIGRMDEEKVPWTQKELDIDGSELAMLAGGPSPLVGRLKEALHKHAVLNPEDNNRKKLMRKAEQLLAGGLGSGLVDNKGCKK